MAIRRRTRFTGPMRKIAATALLALSIGMLSGCVSSATPVPEFDAPADADDALPPGSDVIESSALVESSIRHVGTVQDWRVFIARSSPDDDVPGYCIVLVPADNGAGSGCSTSLPVSITPDDGPTFWFTGDVGTPPDGAEPLSPSVSWVR